MSIQSLQKILDFLWQRFGYKGDKCGCMFKLADMLAEVQSARVPQNFDIVKQNSNKNKKICHSARTD